MKVIISTSVFVFMHLRQYFSYLLCALTLSLSFSYSFLTFLFVCFHRMSKRDCISFRLFLLQQLHVLKFQIYFQQIGKEFSLAFDFCMTQKIKIYNRILTFSFPRFRFFIFFFRSPIPCNEAMLTNAVFRSSNEGERESEKWRKNSKIPLNLIAFQATVE